MVAEKAVDLALSMPTPDVEQTMSRWLRDYIDEPHPALQRDGAVCPFVAPSLKANSLAVRSHQWSGRYELGTMLRLIERTTAMFQAMTWPSHNGNLYALVVVVEGLPPSAWWLIDEAHRLAKDDTVARGMMLGQFHPACDEPSARNPLFPVNRSPYPLYAIRNMALHDILFLHGHHAWFRHYRQRFGHRFEGNARVDPRFARLYRDACERQAEEVHVGGAR